MIKSQDGFTFVLLGFNFNTLVGATGRVAENLKVIFLLVFNLKELKIALAVYTVNVSP